MNTGIEIRDTSFGFVYMWIDKERDMYYIGSHKGSIGDGYLCSSVRCKRAIKKRRDTFERVVIEYAEDMKDLHQRELDWLLFYDAENDKRSYNLKNTANGGSGPSKYKGMKKSEYLGKDWIDPRQGKTHEEIHGKEESKRLKKNIAKQNALFKEENGHGRGYGCTSKSPEADPRRGKTHKEIYGYVRHANPPKPFLIRVNSPNVDTYSILCDNENDFFNKTNLEETTMRELKSNGKKQIKRITTLTKHTFEINTILTLEYLDKNV